MVLSKEVITINKTFSSPRKLQGFRSSVPVTQDKDQLLCACVYNYTTLSFSEIRNLLRQSGKTGGWLKGAEASVTLWPLPRLRGLALGKALVRDFNCSLN